jgi:hypothetical protein
MLLVKNYFEIEFRILVDSMFLFLKRLNSVKICRKEKHTATISFLYTEQNNLHHSRNLSSYYSCAKKFTELQKHFLNHRAVP